MTNNPDKVRALQDLGITVAERVALEVAPRAPNQAYLQTKRSKFGHLLSLASGVGSTDSAQSDGEPKG
jgi:3,4-dihydroxy 2-butanone 4-phosphate synthase/GTP cyclohydrolase II